MLVRGQRRAAVGAAPGRGDARGSRPSCAWRCCPTGKRCPTTTSRRTRTSSPSAWRRSIASRAASATCWWCRRRRRCTGCAPPSFLAAFTFFLRRARRSTSTRCARSSRWPAITHVTQVVSPGEYSVRGGLIDLFPMGSALPYRIDLFDDEIESISTFDVDTPAHALSGARGAAAAGARVSARRRGAHALSQPLPRGVRGRPVASSALYKDIAQRHLPRRHRVLPAAVLRRRPRRWSTTCRTSAVARAARRRRRGASSASGTTPNRAIGCCAATGAAAAAAGGAVPARRRVLRRAQDRFGRVDARAATRPTRAHGRALPAGAGRPPRRRSAGSARSASSTATPHRVLIVAESAGRRETMQHYFAEYGLRSHARRRLRRVPRRHATRAMLVVGAAGQRLRCGREGGLAFVTETELYAGVCAARRARRAASAATSTRMMRDLSELRIGDPVVHVDHGIGRYSGLIDIDLGDGAERVPAARIRGRRQALRAGVATCT